MSRTGWHSVVLLAFAVVWLDAAERPAIQDALAALQRGDFSAAEKTMRAEVQAHPDDASALTLLGVALDGLGKFQEAAPIHRRAIARAPRSADALNNYANHLGGAGDEEGARKQYLATVAVDPAHFNANVQLARLALKRRKGAEALAYLKHLPAGQQEAPPIAILRMEALYLTGDRAAAEALLARLPDDPSIAFQAGAALAEAGQQDRAEPFFARVRGALEAARRQQPQNVDVLYNLAYVYQASRQPEAALPPLAQAAKLAPQRADIQKLLAITTGDVGALEDSAAAWDRYLKLQPNDDAARRERGFAAAQMGKFEDGLRDLEWFAARHPDDAFGQYELGMARSRDDAPRGLAHLDKALTADPGLVAALSARGSLYYQLGKPEAAVADLESAAALRPDDAVILDRLGQTYQALDRTADAVRVLRRAAELAPGDSKIVLHFARALADAGETAESRAVMERFRQLGPVARKGVPAGLVDYLTLTPDQRRADYRTRVEKAAREHSSDAGAQMEYLKLLLDDGKPDQAAGVARTIAGLKPGAVVLADAGRALLEARQYAAAKAVLENAGASADVKLDLAIASFHAESAAAGLRQSDQVSEGERKGDYYLARAQMLDAAGRTKDAAAAIELALRSAPKRAEMYRDTAVPLIRNGHAAQAIRLLDEAARQLPRDRELLLLRAIAMELGGRAADSERALSEIQNRWPEWHAIWLAHGLVLQTHEHPEEARKALETAIALGAPTPGTSDDLRRLFLERPPREW